MDPGELFARNAGKTSVSIEGRRSSCERGDTRFEGAGGFRVPVYLLDSDLPENSAWDRTLTDFLYGGTRITACARR